MSKVFPTGPITFTPDEVRQLYKELRALYHDINSPMTVLAGACELGLDHPEKSKGMFEMMTKALHPNKILTSIHQFGDALEQRLGIVEKPEEKSVDVQLQEIFPSNHISTPESDLIGVRNPVPGLV
jgi:hypothetical protein